jgi:hypothetical protein
LAKPVFDSNIQFGEKEFLLNNSFINITNYEENFLIILMIVTAGKEKKLKICGQYPAVQQN